MDSLFDDLDDQAAAGPLAVAPGITHTNQAFQHRERTTARPDAGGESGLLQLSPASDWQEVPQVRFLSWSPAMQAAYCAARDTDSAIYAESVEDAEWFIRRARIYEGMVR